MIFSSARFLGDARGGPFGMAAQRGDPRLQIVFGRAFLLHLQRGDLEMAALFARAFLKEATRRPCAA